MPLLNTESNQIVLASKSPRRIELLKRIIPHFQVKVSNINENLKENLFPHDLAVKLSRLKAINISSKLEKGIIIGADSIVVINNKIFGKPKNSQESFEMLSQLSGKTHQVITGFTVIKNPDQLVVSDFEITEVKFRNLTTLEIKKYVEINSTLDKAGSYGIQDEAGVFVEKINGCYFNVMGLPITKLYLVLKELVD